MLKQRPPLCCYNKFMSEKVLIVEDEDSLQETLAYNLKRQGYEVDITGDGNVAVSKALEQRPDLILLDIMLEGIDGFEVCRIIRQELNVPIIFLTARDDEIDRVVGFEIGGDDYVSKPFSMRELMARVKARLRTRRLLNEKDNSMPDQEIVKDTKDIRTFGNLQINLKRREILLNGTPLAFKHKEFDLLELFTQHHERAISRDFILQKVWGYDYDGDGRTVDVHVRWLREKIELEPSTPTRIVTIRNIGYRFEG
jgi:DNA-binding response OmpR family regulator